jgi:hypothetical protein
MTGYLHMVFAAAPLAAVVLALALVAATLIA